MITDELRSFIFGTLNKTLLMEMAFARKDAIDELKDQSYEIGNHLLKIIVLDDPLDDDHWRTELYAFIMPCVRKSELKTGGFLTYQDIMEHLWNEPYGHLNQVYEHMGELFGRRSKYSALPRRYTQNRVNWVYSKMKEFYTHIAFIVSNNRIKMDKSSVNIMDQIDQYIDEFDPSAPIKEIQQDSYIKQLAKKLIG